MVVRLDLKDYSMAIPDIHQTGILFSGRDQHLLPFPGEGLQPFDRILITAMLAPHGAKSAQFCKIWHAPQFIFDQTEFLRRKPQLLGRFNGYLHKAAKLRSASQLKEKISRFAGYGV